MTEEGPQWVLFYTEAIAELLATSTITELWKLNSENKLKIIYARKSTECSHLHSHAPQLLGIAATHHRSLKTNTGDAPHGARLKASPSVHGDALTGLSPPWKSPIPRALILFDLTGSSILWKNPYPRLLPKTIVIGWNC